MTDAMVQILVALIGLLGVIITKVIVPYINANTTAKQRDNVWFWVEMAVIAVEKHFEESGKGKLKKETVIEFIINQGYDIPEEQLSILIDAVVEQVINND